jgi:hypothetical protein
LINIITLSLATCSSIFVALGVSIETPISFAILDILSKVGSGRISSSSSSSKSNDSSLNALF